MCIIKKISIILLIIALASVVFVCRPSSANSLEDIFKGGDSFISKGEENKQEIFNEDNEKSVIDQIYFVMLSIAIVLALIVGVVLGIQFITTGAAGQAKVKEKLIPFVVGAIVVFGGFGIWRLIYTVLKSIVS